MRLRVLVAGLSVATMSAPVRAQSQPPTPPNAEVPIVVTGERPDENAPSVVTRLRDMIEESDTAQLARFEASICPMVIGMPRDLTPIIARIIRANIVEAGGKVGTPGCKANAAAIFIDEPQQLVTQLYKADPSYFVSMTPRTFSYFAGRRRPVYSWHTTSVYARKALMASRLYTPVEEEMDVGMVVIDRQATIGKSVRQLADFATLHLMLDINWRAPRHRRGSILALFDDRKTVPRMSSFDRTALRAFYAVRDNNYAAAMQRQNIARAMRRIDQGKPPVGTQTDSSN